MGCWRPVSNKRCRERTAPKRPFAYAAAPPKGATGADLPQVVEVPEPADEALHSVLHKIVTRLMKLLSRRGCWLKSRVGPSWPTTTVIRTMGRSNPPHPLAAAGSGARIPHHLRSACCEEGADGEGRDAQADRLQAKCRAPASTGSACAQPCAVAPTTPRRWSNCVATTHAWLWPMRACKPGPRGRSWPSPRHLVGITPVVLSWARLAAAPGQMPGPLRGTNRVRARLLKRVFEIDIEYWPNCDGERKIVAAILEQPVFGGAVNAQQISAASKDRTTRVGRPVGGALRKEEGSLKSSCPPFRQKKWARRPTL